MDKPPITPIPCGTTISFHGLRTRTDRPVRRTAAAPLNALGGWPFSLMDHIPVCKTVSIGARWPLVFRMRSSARWRWQSTLAFTQQLVNLSSLSGVMIAAGVEFDGAAFVGQGLVVALYSTTSTSPTRASAWST